MNNLLNSMSYYNLIRVALFLYAFSLQAYAQNAAEKKHISYTKDSAMVLNAKSYLRELKKKGFSAAEARNTVNNLQKELENINRSGGKKMQGDGTVVSTPLLVPTTTPTFCWRDGLYPGEETSGSCTCTIPSGTPPACPNNLGFKDGNFNGWLGRIGTYYTVADDCNFGLAFDPTPVFKGPDGVEPARHLMVTRGGVDPFGGFPLVEPGSSNNYAVRLGNARNGAKAEQLVYKFRADATNHYLNYKYAVVLQDPGDHRVCHRPSFSVELYKVSDCGASAVRISCGSFIVQYANNLPGFSHFYGAYVGVYKPWTNVMFDLSPYIAPGTTEDFYIKFTTTDCAWGGHFGYAYIDGACLDQLISYDNLGCIGSPIRFFAPGNIERGLGAFYTWKVDDVIVGDSTSVLSYSFTNTTSHNVKCIFNPPSTSGCTTVTSNIDVHVEQCHAMYLQCEDDCVASFAPEPGKKYVLSAWVKETSGSYLPTYANAKVRLRFTIPITNCSTCVSPGACITPSGGGLQCEYTYDFFAKGKIIDGWQRIEEVVTVPAGATEMFIELISPTGTTAYFDDIRIFPFDGSMKSYVYDPISQKLLAELDENNYATFYEYDQEGNLVRVKKETERGVKTIKESMSNTSVKP